MLLQEIERAEADIICLCEENFHARFWVPQLKIKGFDKFVRSEKSCSPCQYFFPKEEEDIMDGCAIFWRSRRFAMAEDFSQPLQADGGKVAGLSAWLTG